MIEFAAGFVCEPIPALLLQINLSLLWLAWYIPAVRIRRRRVAQTLTRTVSFSLYQLSGQARVCSRTSHITVGHLELWLFCKCRQYDVVLGK